MKIRSLIAVALLGTGALRASVIDDFERESAGIPASPALSTPLASTDNPQNPGKALALEWPSPHGLWVECAYREPRAVPELAADNAIAVRMDVWVPASPSIISLGLRFIDKGN